MASIKMGKKSKQPKEEKEDLVKVEWTDAKDEPHDTCMARVWTTKDGRYRAVMVTPRYGGGVYFATERRVRGPAYTYWDSVEKDPMGPGYPKHYHDLRSAINAVERHYAGQLGVDEGELTSNKEDVLLRYAPELPKPTVREPAVNGTAQPREPRAPRARTGEVDAWGSRVGSDQAAANAVITKEPQTMKEIVQKAGLPGTVYGHMNKMCAKGFVVKDGNT